MNLENPREFIHSWYLLLITFLALLFLLISRNLFLELPILIIVFCFYFKNGLSISKFRLFFMYASFFAFGLFVLNLLYPSHELQSGNSYQICGHIFYQKSLSKAFNTMTRLFMISILSMSSVAVINYTKVVLHLIVHKGLKLFWGYPILLAMNSIVLFKEEYERIRINGKLRDLPWYDQFSLIFPLLVFAIRHSQRGAMSLVTRGLNQNKTFYFTYELSHKDRFLLALFTTIYLVLVVFAINLNPFLT